MNLLMYANILWMVLVFALASACGRTESDASESEAALKTLRLGTFNMLRYGHGEKNDDRLAALIIKSKYQVFSGIEIMDKDAAYALRDKLKALSGKKWELALSSYASGETTYKEYLGFYYRSDLIKPISAAEGFCATKDAVAQTSNGCFAKDVGTDDGPAFDRDPFVAQFQIGSRKFAVAAIHLVWGGSDTEAVQRRVNELFELRTVLQKVRTSAQGYNVLAAGDFNLSLAPQLAGQGQVVAAAAGKIPESFFSGSPAMTGLITGPTTIGLSNYDHVFYLNDNDVKHVSGSESIVTDFDLSDDQEKKLFQKEVSDHFPAGVKLAL